MLVLFLGDKVKSWDQVADHGWEIAPFDLRILSFKDLIRSLSLDNAIVYAQLPEDSSALDCRIKEQTGATFTNLIDFQAPQSSGRK